MIQRVLQGWQAVARWERLLFGRFLSGWRFVGLLVVGVGGLAFVYSSHHFIFAHPNFLILVLAPPVLTWNKWARLKTEARPYDVFAPLAILSGTLKISVILLLIFKCLPTFFIAPYAFIHAPFWGEVAFVLILQTVLVGLMRQLSILHPRPYLFFVFAYFPFAGLYYAFENALLPGLGWGNAALFTLAVGLIMYDPHPRRSA